MRFLALADDLTGALEVGAKFAEAALATRVVTINRLMQCGEAQALVVDTETRHVAPEQACATIAQIAATGGRPTFVYKKTDSTLRGNIAAELSGLSKAFPGSPIIYVPGYPEMGRSVVNGRLLVDGIPVCRSAFADDPLNPVMTDDITALLAARTRAILIDPGQIAAVSEPAVYVVNTANSEDVRKAAHEFHRAGLRLAAGPAGFAGRLTEWAGRGRAAPAQRPPIHRCLLVNGSLHPRSLAQLRAASRLYGPAHGPKAAVAALDHEGWVLLEPETGAGIPHRAAAGGAVAAVLREAEIDAIVVFGGDTAFGILHELGDPPLEPLGEIIPGVPVARIDRQSLRNDVRGIGDSLFLVTKAGGFGPIDILPALQAALAHP